MESHRLNQAAALSSCSLALVAGPDVSTYMDTVSEPDISEGHTSGGQP